MRKYSVGMAGFDKFERRASVVAGNRLMAKPHDCAVGITGQLLGCGENMNDRLEALLHKRRLRALRERVSMHMRQLCKIRERQAQATAHALGRDEVPFMDIGQQGGQHAGHPMCIDKANIALLAHFES